MNLQKISARGSIFNEVSRNDALMRAVGVGVRGVLREAWGRVRGKGRAVNMNHVGGEKNGF